MYADFNDWLAAHDFDRELLSAGALTKLQAQWRAEQNPPAPEPKPEPAAEKVKVESGGFDEKMAAIEAETHRVEYIRAATVRACEANVGNTAKIAQLRALCDAAIADQKTDTRAFDLALLRADRFSGPMVVAGARDSAASAQAVEAAVCRRAGLKDIEEHFDARTLEASERAFRDGLGVQDLMAMTARQNGWRGASVKAALNSKDFWRQAFADEGGPPLMAGTTGPSTYSLPNIFSNVANKFLRTGFMAVDSAWREISARRSFSDFKTATTITPSGSMIYKEVAPGGEIQHGDLAETTYSNAVDTYGIMFGIDRRDLINDDLGALSTVGARIGRGAALKINDVFWTVFLNNSSFFASGNSNVSTGAGSALGTAEGAAINAAEVVFINQTDPDGNPVAVMPRIMLVPPTLANTARRWMGSQGFTISGTAGGGDTNVYAGRYQIVTSPYMENSSYTGYSAAAWYLLADPADMPVVEVGFLNGRDTPTVETAEADFNQLGIGLRGYLDFGVALVEYRGGVRSAGS